MSGDPDSPFLYCPGPAKPATNSASLVCVEDNWKPGVHVALENEVFSVRVVVEFPNCRPGRQTSFPPHRCYGSVSTTESILPDMMPRAGLLRK